MHRQAMTDYGAPLQPLDGPTPVPKGSEVLVRVSHCGLCHSDIHLHDGHFDMGGGKQLDIRAQRTLPFTLGHEIAGRVEAAGPEASGVKIGARVAVYPWTGCGTCARCLRGDEHLCDTVRHLGVNLDGGFATHVLAPHPRHLVDIEGIPPEVAGSLMCSGVTAFGALKKAMPYLDGRPLLIVGLGGVGMMGLQVALAVANAPVVVADIDPAKREAALAAGAKHAFDPREDGVRKLVFKACGPVAAAVDFAGSEASLDFAQSVVGKAGALVISGLMGGRFSLPAPMFPFRSLSVLGTFVGSPGDAHELAALVREGKVKPIPVRVRPLAEANEAMDDLRHGRVLGRVVLTP